MRLESQSKVLGAIADLRKILIALKSKQTDVKRIEFALQTIDARQRDIGHRDQTDRRRLGKPRALVRRNVKRLTGLFKLHDAITFHLRFALHRRESRGCASTFAAACGISE